MKEVFIVSMARTPIGNLNGKLSNFSAVDLGALAIKGAIERAGISKQDVQEIFGSGCTKGQNGVVCPLRVFGKVRGYN